MTSEEDWQKRLERILKRLARKNGDSQSSGTSRQRSKEKRSRLDDYKNNPNKDRGGS